MTDALALIHRLFWPQANDPYATVHTLRMLDQTMRNTIADSVTDIAGAWRRRYSVLNAQARGAVSVDRPIGHSAALLSTLRQYKAWADKFSEASSRLHTLPMAASDAAYERLQSDRSLMLLLIDADALLAQITATAPHLVDLIEQADPSAEEKSRTFLDDLNHALSQRKSLLTPVF